MLDDLLACPQAPYPAGYTPDNVTDALIAALDKHGLTGVDKQAPLC
jgi:hypothetical protein